WHLPHPRHVPHGPQRHRRHGRRDSRDACRGRGRAPQPARRASVARATRSHWRYSTRKGQGSGGCGWLDLHLTVEAGVTFEEAKRVLAALQREGVAYVLVGSMGMAAHGLIRATRDIDLFVEPSEDNVDRLK